jgi:hypothetical protein
MKEQLKSYKTVEQIAKKHRMDVSDIQKQLDMGAPIEHEHTNNKKLAVEIALQHLDEFPDYYTRLKKMEASAKKEHKKFKDVKEDAVTDLQRGIVELPNASYGSIDSLMKDIGRKKNISPKKLHDDFVDKHNQTPDTWAKKNMKEEADDNGFTKCWRGKKKKGFKMKNGKKVNNCVPVNSESTNSLGYDWDTPVRERADRYCPKCEKLERRTECKYGTKYWDMFSLPAEVVSSKKDYNITMPHPGNMPEEKDHEYSMARSELSTIVTAAKRLRKKIGKGEGNLKAWVQSKITKAADYIDTAADYIDSGEMKKESISIEDANGNHYAQFIDIIKPQPLIASKGIGSKLLGENVGTSIKLKTGSGLGGGVQVYPSGQGPKIKSGEGPELPKLVKQAKAVIKKEVQVAHYNMKTFGQFMIEAKKSEMKCNSPKSQPVGDSLTGKSHVVKACANGEEKLIRFGQRGVKGSPKKKGESKQYASRRNRFKTRHAKNIAKGPMSAAYWANKVKW